MKRILMLALAMVLICSCALGEKFTGSTVTWHSTDVTSPSGGVLQDLHTLVGQQVTAGEKVATTRINRLYATQDGTITKVEYKAGEKASGTAVCLFPMVSRYTVKCTTKNGYKSPETKWLRIGEEVLIRCTKDGTHLGVGTVVSVDGLYYDVQMTGGEMFVGETVYIYRDDMYVYENRVGTGTVTRADDEQYTVDGTILSVNVSVGDEVSRGQLLLTWAGDADTDITIPEDGIITEILQQNGTTLATDQAVLRMTAYDDIYISVVMEDKDAVRIKEGDKATYTLKVDLEQEHTAVVYSISGLGEDGCRTVTLKPDVPETIIGATADVELALRDME